MTSMTVENSDEIFKKGCDMIAQGKLHEAASVLEAFFVNNARHAPGLSKLGVAYILLGRRGEAIEAFRKAITADESFIPAYNNLALALAEEEAFESAASCAQAGLDRDPSYAPLYVVRAMAMKALGRMEEAVACLRRAADLDGENPEILANLGGALLENGKTEEAERCLMQALALAPGYAAAHRMLSSFKAYEENAPQIAFLEELAKAPNRAPDEKADLEFALGRIYERQKKYEASFAHYRKANRAMRDMIAYDPEKDRRFFGQIKDVFTPEFIRENAVQERQEITPVFILGMPRSGTSLAEQILASHPDIYGAGELNLLDHLQFRTYGLDRTCYAQDVKDRLAGETMRALARDYLDGMKSRSDGALFVTDKMPQNFLYIGLIRCLFPQAKIIHCRRDPRDVCLSIYKTRFTGALPFAYDLDDIAGYYELYDDLMTHWRNVVPGFIYDLDYEALVNGPEGTIRALLEFCGVPWSEECLAFHRSERSVATASTLQVRRPLYKTALAYWKNYEPYLGKGLDRLSK